MIIWVAKVGQRLEAIPRIAARDLFEEARRPIQSGGNMPVDKGNLRNSATISFVEVPQTDLKIDKNTRLTNPAANINKALETMPLGSRVRLGFRAEYALEQEHKHAFVRLAAQKWIGFVEGAVRKAKRRIP